jgi:hypothetical protein
MATVSRAWVDTLLLSCRSRLVDKLRFPEERVLVADPDALELPTPQGDQIACLWYEGLSPRGPVFSGGGRVDTRMDCRIVAALYTRCALDERASSLSWLTDRALGHLRAARLLFDALLAYYPVDQDDNALVFEPLHPAPLTRPRRKKDSPGWGESRLGFAVSFVADVDQDIQ